MATARSKVLIGGAVALGATLTACLAGTGLVWQSARSAQDLAAHPAPGDLLQVDGRLLHLHCIGDGAPVVVFITGLNGTASVVGPVQRAAAETTRACAYDRAGLGYSEPTDHPRRAAETADELAALLDAAVITEPLVLVGHSWGGILARSFATRQPDRVAGMVLIDSSHEGQLDALGEAAAEGVPLPFQLGRVLQPLGVVRLAGMVEAATASIPTLSDADRASLIATSGQSHTSRANGLEFLSMAAELDARGAPPDLRDLPLIVLSQDGHGPEGLSGDELTRWQGLQRDLASRSSAGRLEIVADSGHVIMWDQPDAVTAAIRDVVRTIREQSDPAAP
ncbi:MAG: alpha/beta hydrolase [Alphaproteobacteria bacterium]|nr:alpha/beta hydrolase [Alphaproteobacteria bacterium]